MEQNLDFRNYFSKVFGIMSLGLVTSAVTGYLALRNIIARGFLYQFLMFEYSFFVLIIVEFGLVAWMTAGLSKMSPNMMRILFFIYSIVNGLTFGVLPLAYGVANVFMAFGLAAVFFVVMAIISKTTKLDLSKFGGIFLAGLITIIVVSLINYFVKSPFVSGIVPYFGVFVFMGLTAYDVQKLKAHYQISTQDQKLADKMAIFGALQLYLDFVNIFLFILRILGGKRK